MNALIQAHNELKTIITKATSSTKSTEDLRNELKKLTKDELIDKLISTMKIQKITVESVAKPILESEACTWLTYEEIAESIAAKLGTNTSKKSIADYASKRDWDIKARKTQSERLALLKTLI